jgi:dipeptidyl aminopeptidase/acylaminoacyl peptidase
MSSSPMRWLVRVCVLVSLTAPPLLLPVTATAQDTRTVTVDDLFAMQAVGDPQLSPEGRWIAYTVRSTSLEDEESETRIWMVPTAGGEAIPMTASGTSGSRPRWSPDGKYLTFLASRGGKGEDDAKTQVWALNRLGGEAQPLTDVKEGVASYDWSPDASSLLLSIRDAEEKSDSTEGKKETPKPWVIDRLQFKRDGAGYLTGHRHTHLYVFDLATKLLRQITSGDYDESQAAWSPDGTRVAFVSNRTADPDGNQNSDIWVVQAIKGDSGRTAVQITTNPGSDVAPAWSPDGQAIAYVTSLEPELIWYDVNALAVVSAKGGVPRLLNPTLDRNVGSPRFTPDGRAIVFELEDSGEDHLAAVDVESGRLSRPIAGPLAVHDYDQGKDGRLVALIAKLDRPSEIFVLDPSGLRQVTGANDAWLANLQLAAVKDVTFSSRDGTEIEGFIYLPPDYRAGTRYPTLLRIHGGPVSQFTHSFNFESQLLAANGYVVVNVNPRGSSGYGQEFSRAIWADWGNKDYDDVMAGVDYAIAQGYADPDRLGVGGWSYGGILTDHVITKTDRFRAAISGASEVLYVANYGHDHYQLEWEKELGLPWQHRDVWERISPFNNVEDIVTPTLIMGGESDWNVPIQNSEQLYQALKRLGRTTELVVYPGQPHGLRVPSYQKDRLERYLAWYGKYVKNLTQADGGDGK